MITKRKDPLGEIREEIKAKKKAGDWELLMIRPVIDFVTTLDKHIDWKKKQWDGPRIDSEVWKLLEKAKKLILKDPFLKSRNN
jgi:hypothetical protein